MTDAHQPETMRLADWLELHAIDGIERKAAAELRRLIEVEKQHNKLRDQRNELLEALRSVWLWMDDQADGQSKGGHATFDLMLLREQRDIARSAIAKAEGEKS